MGKLFVAPVHKGQMVMQKHATFTLSNVPPWPGNFQKGGKCLPVLFLQIRFVNEINPEPTLQC